MISTSGNSVTKIDPNSSSLYLYATTYAVGPSPTGIAFDGDSIWVTNSGNNTVTKIAAF